MRKPDQIRKIITDSNPDFKKNPDKLLIFVDNGELIATGATSLSHEYRYILNIIITDYADDIAKINVPLLAYLKINQPEIFHNPNRRENTFTFEVDHINHTTRDISIKIKLTERVIVQTDENGNANIKYADEPTYKQIHQLDVYVKETHIATEHNVSEI